METDSRPSQIKNAVERFDFCHSELVIGIVCAVGTDYGPIRDSIIRILQKHLYRSRAIRISDLIPRFTDESLPTTPETARINSLMTAGNAVCRANKRKDYWALAAIAEINASRERTSSGPEPLPRTGHILLSLKRPEEVATLRKVYGDGFFLIGVFATERERLDFLIERNAPKDAALELIKRDAEESTDAYGQYTRETFHLSDVFVQFRDGLYEKELERFFGLVFSDPYITPTQQEHAMFLAYAASLRSAQLGRQVGAALTSKMGDILSVGCNDVPKTGGGLYWPGEPDGRDHVRGEDTNDKQREKIIDQLIAAATEADVKRVLQIETITRDVLAKSDTKPQEIIEQIQKRQSELGSLDEALRQPFRKRLDITEYGRAVHAEMDALLTCARSGVSPMGATLYTTTFPCHNCTRHIIAAGIERVFYIEPYAKSKAEELHEDEIVVEEKLEKKRTRDRRLPFRHFVGVGPRRYFDLFSLMLSSGHELIRKKDGEVLKIEQTAAWARIPLSPYSYLEKEEIAIEQLDAAYDDKQLDMFNPKE